MVKLLWRGRVQEIGRQGLAVHDHGNDGASENQVFSGLYLVTCDAGATCSFERKSLDERMRWMER
ncbi:hypothetical protein BTE77_10930 [Ensifer adhaerens]|nr:hypothetical protein BTE77_10930 [Ensifer adhaerens]